VRRIPILSIKSIHKKNLNQDSTNYTPSAALGTYLNLWRNKKINKPTKKKELGKKQS
jgi:hypothetical protein